MPVPTSINDLSTTAGSNSPPGTEAPTLTDDYLRVYASYIAALRDVVLSGTANLSTANLTYTGTLTGSTGVLNIGAGQIYKDAAGLVGVGTTTPQVRLSVATTGDTVGLSVGEAGSATGKTVDIGYYVTANYGRIQAVHAGTGFKDLALNPSGGGVGIGTTTPATRLEVSGSSAIVRVTGTAGTAPRLELSSTGVVNWSLRSNNASASELTVFKDSTECFRIKSTGQLNLTGLAAAPAGAAGDIYYDSVTNKHYGHNGTSWNALY